MLAFESRIRKNKKWRCCKPNKAERIIEKMEDDFEEWTSLNTRKKMHKFANDYFTSNIIDP